MKDLKEFNISFTGLKVEKHRFDYQIDKKFFEYFQYDEFEKAAIKVSLDFEKTHNSFYLKFNSEGLVTVLCDLTSEPFELEVAGDLSLIVRFGEEFNNDDEDILIIPYNAFQFDVSQFIYEMIVLSLPSKRIHPGIAEGTLNSEVLRKLEEYQVRKEIIDPRWEKLKELKTIKKS